LLTILLLRDNNPLSGRKKLHSSSNYIGTICL
jgi:hypothetical protein